MRTGHNRREDRQEMTDPTKSDLLVAQRQRAHDELATMHIQPALLHENIRALTEAAIRQDTEARNALVLLHCTMDRVAQLEDAACTTWPAEPGDGTGHNAAPNSARFTSYPA